MNNDTKRELANMNTEDFNIMRDMLSEIERNIMQLHPLHQKEFYKHMQTVILYAWEDTCNPNDRFLFHNPKDFSKPLITDEDNKTS
jgi:hypothetical protein